MKKSTSNFILKSINEQKVLRIIYIEGPISRVEIAKRTGLTQQTITNIVNRFLDKEVVIEAGPGDNTHGRKSIQLKINGSNILAIGVGISKKFITAVLMNFHMEPIKKMQVELPKGDKVLECIFNLIDELITYTPEDYVIEGIGCSVQGLVDSQRGIVISSSGSSWENFPLKNKLEERYGIPANLENDVNLIGLVENLKGVLHSAKNSLIFNFDYGIGSAITYDKQLYEGTSFVAGEIGHYKAFLGEDAHRCYCGKYGCLTTLASIKGLEKNTPYTVNEFRILLNQGDRNAKELLNKIRKAIIESISNIVIFLNPDSVLITGKFIQELGPHLLSNLEAEIIESLPMSCNNVIFHYLFDDIDYPSMSVSLVIDNFFRIPLKDLSLKPPGKMG